MTDSRVPSHGELPLPDYDHLPAGSLQARIRSLDKDELSSLLAYEREHAGRVVVTQLLEHRLSELAAGAEPTAGSPNALRPETSAPPAGGDPISPQTAGPPINPPSHGDPTNPAQPRG